MSQSATPWNADNFGTSSGSIGTIKLYNPADFQNNTAPGQFSGSAFQPFPVGGSTIIEQPGKACDTGQQQPPVPAVFQSYNPNTGQPTNQVPPDKDSSDQFNQSQTNATMNGSWGWDPSWGEPSNSWLSTNSSNQYSDGDGSFSHSFDKHNMQGSAVHYFDQNQNFPQNASAGQDWSAVNSQQHQSHPQMTQVQQQSQQQMAQVQQQSQQQMAQVQQQSQQQMAQVQQQSQQQMQQVQQSQQQMQQVQQQSQQQMSQIQQSQQQMQQVQQQSHQQMLPPQQQHLSHEGSPNSSQNTSLPPTNVPQYLDVATSSALPYSQSEYPAFNDYVSPMSLSTPSMGAPSSLSSPSTGQMSSDQQFGQANLNPPSLNWPEAPADPDLSKPMDQHNEPALPSSNPGQLANMGSQPNASNYFSSQDASEQSLWQPTKPVEENSGQFPLGTPASGPVPLSAPGSLPMSVSEPMPLSTSGPMPLSSVGPMPISTTGPIPTSGLPQQSAWTDSSHKQNIGDCSVPQFQPYHTNPQTAESYFFLDGNSTNNTKNTSSGTIAMDTITQSFSQASISESTVAENIPNDISDVCQTFTDVSLGNNSIPDSSKTAEVTSLLLHQQNPQQQINSSQFPTGIPIDSTIKHNSVAGDREVVSNPDSNQHSRQSSLGNAQSLEGSNQNSVALKTATTISSSQPLLPVNQAILDSFNIANSEPNIPLSLPLSKPSSSGQPLSVAPPIPSLTTPQSTEVQPEVGTQHEAKVTTDDLSSVVNNNMPSVEGAPNAAFMKSFDVKTSSCNNSVPTLPKSLPEVGAPKLDGNTLLNEHKLNVYASEIQPRDSSPFQPPPPRQGSLEGIYPLSTSRSSSQESGHASQTSRTSGQIRSGSSDGGRSSCGSQSGGTRPPPTLSRQSSHDSTRSLGSNTGTRSGMEQIKEQAGVAKLQPPLPSGNKGSSWHDQTSAAIRATAAAEARLQECMSPMTTLWDNPQISVSGIHLIPSVPISSLVGANSGASVANQSVSVAKVLAVESKPNMENPKNQSQLSERSSNSQPLTSTPNSSAAVTASSHESSPIKPEQKSPAHSLDDISVSEQEYDRKDPRDRFPRDRDRDRDPRDRDPRDRDPRDRDPRDRDPRDRDPRDRDPRDRDHDPRDPDFRDPRDVYDEYRELRDSRREKDYRYMRDYDRDYRSRYRSLDPKDPRYDPYYERPSSRMDYDRYLEYQYYRDEAYDRPRSRQGQYPKMFFLFIYLFN